MPVYQDLGMLIATGVGAKSLALGSLMYNTNQYWDFPVVQWLRPHAHKAGRLGLIPGQGTRFHN